MYTQLTAFFVKKSGPVVKAHILCPEEGDGGHLKSRRSLHNSVLFWEWSWFSSFSQTETASTRWYHNLRPRYECLSRYPRFWDPKLLFPSLCHGSTNQTGKGQAVHQHRPGVRQTGIWMLALCENHKFTLRASFPHLQMGTKTLLED